MNKRTTAQEFLPLIVSIVSIWKLIMRNLGYGKEPIVSIVYYKQWLLGKKARDFMPNQWVPWQSGVVRELDAGRANATWDF